MANLTKGGLVDLLKEEFGIQTDKGLSESLGMSFANWRNVADSIVSSLIVKRAIKAAMRYRLRSVLQPLIEYHPFVFEHGKNVDSFANRLADKGIVASLGKAYGIYAFFDSAGKIIYLGKAEKQHLFPEMEQQYRCKTVPFRVIENGLSKWKYPVIKYIAEYVSAYSVQPELISNVEALITRTIINNSTNLRAERFRSLISGICKPLAFRRLGCDGSGMQDAKPGSHTIWDCKYRVVWITKYRFPVLGGDVGQRARELLREISRAHEMTIYAGAINRDHVHMLIGMPPHLSVSRAVQYLKGKSSHKLLSEYQSLRKRYWGQHLWGRGYWVATSGNVTDEVWKKYIEDQKPEVPDDNFKVV